MPKKNPSRNAVAGSSRNNIEVMLTEDVPDLGSRGKIARVKPGYARNYLLPQGLATIATEENKQALERHKSRLEQILAEQIRQLKTLADTVSKYSVTLEANATKEGHLYGSIVATDISKALVGAGYQVNEDHIRLEGPLKETGMYTVKLEFHPEVRTEVKVWVVPTVSKA